MLRRREASRSLAGSWGLSLCCPKFIVPTSSLEPVMDFSHESQDWQGGIEREQGKGEVMESLQRRVQPFVIAR